jgi:hypothetical protein
MLKLKDYLIEERNTHMEHIEDLVFNEGVNGTRRAINFLRDLRDMLAGNSSTKITATVKWDGAPAIFAGIDPRDGKFFVAKKGVFNKEPKVYKTPAEVDADTSGDLADKLKLALQEFKKLGIKSGVYQGDLMFTQSDLRTEVIDDVSYTTFHPNTIVYAVPHDSILGKKIRTAKIGVVWHTTYTGDSFETMKASFGQDITPKFKQVPSVWMDDATYKDHSGVATFTAAETKQVTNMLSQAGTLFRGMDPKTLNAISGDEELLMLVKTYNNTKVRAGQRVTNPKAHVDGLFKWIYDRFQKEADAKKTEKGRSTAEEKRKKIMSFFANHDKGEIVKIFELSNMIADIKGPIIAKMNDASRIKTMVKTPTGFRVTSHEGYVAIDHLKGGAVKIVDRMEFSKNNFSAEIVKGWQR